MSENIGKREVMLTHQHELVKQYVTFDGFDRISASYVARSDAPHGTVCIKTEYGYDGDTERIQKRKESYATWDSSWDL